MENSHLTYFKVENFKKFDSLEVNDIGQFNLIVGDNNVGKTCLLEALLFDEDGEILISNFHMGLTKRGMIFKPEKIPYEINNKIIFDYQFPQGHYFDKIAKNFEDTIRFIFEKSSKKNKSEILVSSISAAGNKQFESTPELTIPFTNHIIQLNNKKSLNIYNYNENLLDFSLVSFNDSPLAEETIKIYEALKTKSEKDILIKVLKIVNTKIIGIDFRENYENLKSVFLISYEDKNEFTPLNFLGDGFKRIFYIVLKMLSLRGKRILIDEIEIGIHHTKIKDFWINIFKVCKELDVQLFATTHSEECIEAFVEASNEVSYDDIRLIQLQTDIVDNKTYATTFKYKNIKAGINSNLKMLG